MHPALVIAWYDIKRVLRERETLFWLFVGPVIFTVFFGLLFRPEPARRPMLIVVNQDATDDIVRRVSPYLEQDGVTVRLADAVAANRLSLVVPAGALKALEAGKSVDFVLHAGAEETGSERTLRFKFQKAITNVYFALDRNADRPHAPATGDGLATVTSGPLFMTQADIGVRKQDVTAGFQRSVPSYLVMFVFLNLLVSGAGIAEDRASGRLRRMSMAPVSRRAIVLGKLLGRFTIGWIQIIYMLGFGLIVGIRWADHPWVFFAFLSLFALAAASLGILLGTLFKDPDKCASLAVWVAVLLSPLGGLWWPIELGSPVMRQISYFVPTGWAMEGVNSMLAFGAGAVDVAPFALGFLALFAVSFPLAARRLETGP
ncbi:MAG: ABC transporter permease [Acidobacteria bacterium]|nr:ABC transporter permease [Acidobacteriota bacterium]